MTPIDTPTQQPARTVDSTWTVLPASLPVPGLGVLPVNAFLRDGPEPLLVDTGLAALRQPFLDTLGRCTDLTALRWIWLSHLDADHAGNLEAVLARAPQATVVTSFLGMGKLNLQGFDVSRIRVLAQDEPLAVAGHRLRPVRPPYYDAPETIGFFDETERALFVADSFGALLPGAAPTLSDIADGTLREGLLGWSAIDAPWLAMADHRRLGAALAAVERLAPRSLLTAHLPPSTGAVSRITDILADGYLHRRPRRADPLSLEAVAATAAA